MFAFILSHSTGDAFENVQFNFEHNTIKTIPPFIIIIIIITCIIIIIITCICVTACPANKDKRDCALSQMF